LQRRRPEHDAPAIPDDYADPDADGSHDPGLAGHHHPNAHVRWDVSSGLRLNVPAQLRIRVASGLQRRRRSRDDRAAPRRAGAPLRPCRDDISARLQMSEPPFKGGDSPRTSWSMGRPVSGGSKTHATLRCTGTFSVLICSAPGRAELRICLALSEAWRCGFQHRPQVVAEASDVYIGDSTIVLRNLCNFVFMITQGICPY
jgi:hypothetical protein